eukprot:366070-Chlamydomonas_euryale.AAC.5
MRQPDKSHEVVLEQVKNSFVQGDLGTLVSSITAGGCENINHAPDWLSVLVVAAVTMTSDLLIRGTRIIIAYISRMHAQAF